MDFAYLVTYLKCQSCSAKNHCRQCSDEAAVALLRSGAATSVDLDLQQKTIRGTCSDEDALLDALDAAGIFAD